MLRKIVLLYLKIGSKNFAIMLKIIKKFIIISTILYLILIYIFISNVKLHQTNNRKGKYLQNAQTNLTKQKKNVNSYVT